MQSFYFPNYLCYNVEKEWMIDMKNQDMKYRLAQAIKEEMKTKPLDKITVCDIVEVAATTRQSFYRHFQDKYDLVNWYFERLAEKSFKLLGIQYTLREGLIKKFEFIEQERNFFSQAFLSKDHNSLMHYDYLCIYQFYKDLVEQKTGNPITEQQTFLLEMYCHGSIQMTVNWVTAKHPKKPEVIVDLLIEAMPNALKEILF